MVGGSSAIGGRFGSSRLMAWTPPSGRRVRPLQATPPPSRAPMPRPWASSSCRSFAASLLALVIVALLSGGAVGSGCRVEQCTRQFQSSAMANGGVRRGPSGAFCVILRQYSDCLRSTARSCRGHLAYHTTITLVQNWNVEFNCSYVATSALPQRNPDHARPPTNPKHERPQYEEEDDEEDDEEDEEAVSVNLEPTARVYRPRKPPLIVSSDRGGGGGGGGAACNYQGPAQVRHCSFFGDPHLVTFNGQFQTCKVNGAWPLIDNAYLAVSVTNEAVVPGSPATATTKITIIIKGGSDCAPERTYEATVDSIPASFVDGSKFGRSASLHPHRNLSPSMLEQLSPVRIIEKEANRHVEIHARHLGATLIIRQVGNYLTFSARLPHDIAEQGSDREGLQLCVKGCPLSERIDVAKVLNRDDSIQRNRFHRNSAGINGMNRVAALVLCREYNLTDSYLDSCMFDLMTTGDPSFSLAASQAQSDFMTLVPGAAKMMANRTRPLSSTTSPASQGSLSSSAPVREAHGPGRPLLAVVFNVFMMSLLFSW